MGDVKRTVTFYAEDVSVQNAALLERAARQSLYKPIHITSAATPYASWSCDREPDDNAYNNTDVLCHHGER